MAIIFLQVFQNFYYTNLHVMTKQSINIIRLYQEVSYYRILIIFMIASIRPDIYYLEYLLEYYYTNSDLT